MWGGRIALGMVVMALATAAGAHGLTLAQCLTLALQHNTSVAIQRAQLESARAEVLAANAPFDTMLSAQAGRRRDERGLRSDEQLLAPGGDTSRTFSSGYQLDVGRTLENGLGLKAGAAFVSRDDRLERVAGLPPTSSGTVSFALSVPLARNAGAVAGAARSAAQSELDAARADLEHATAAGLLDVALAYWDYAARQRRLEVAIASHERSSALVDELRRMIAADEVPAAEINTALANQAQRAAARAAAQSDLADARRRLVRAMGLGLGAAKMAALPAPADDFPVPPADVRIDAQAWLDAALARRPDLRGAALRLAGAHARLEGAREARKPQVELGLELASNGLREDTRLGGTAFHERRGTSAGATLSFAWPVQNSGANAGLLAASSRRDTLQLAQREQQDAAATGIVTAAEHAARAVEQLHAGREAVRRFRGALEAEQAKRRGGLSTVLDVIVLEERLNGALLAEADLSQQYASAIVQLRFELAQLLRREGDGSYAFNVADFFHLPATLEPRS